MKILNRLNLEIEIRRELTLLAEEDYKAFQVSLMPTVSADTVLGIRTPVLRKFAAELKKTDFDEDFLAILPHKYYEENNLHAFLIEKLGDFDRTVDELKRFLPYVDNWATCDSMNPKILGENKEKLLPLIEEFLNSTHTYTVRYGIGLLMRYFLGDSFRREYAELVASIKSDEYYIKMMQAWYFATALASNYKDIIPYIENRILDPWTHKKAIQKAVESRRISKETKEYLKTLK